MMSLLAFLQSGGDDLWSRLLGIDRVNLEEGTISLDWHHPWPLFAIVLLVIPAIAGLVWLIYRRERRDVGLGPKIVMAGLRSAIFLLVFLMLLGPILSVEVIKMRRAYLLVLVDDSLSMRRSDPPSRPEDQLALAKVTNLWNADERLPDNVRAELLKLTRADIIRKTLENPRLGDPRQKEKGILAQLENKLNVAYFTFSKGARAVDKRESLLEHYRPENCLGTETAIGDAIKQALSMYKGLFVAGVVIFSDGRNNLGIEPEQVARQLRQRYVPVFTVCAGIPQEEKDIALLEPDAKQIVRANDIHALKYTVRSEGFDREEIDISLHVYPLQKDEETKDWQLVERAELDRLLADPSTQSEGTHRFTLQEDSERQRDEVRWLTKTPGHYLVIVQTAPHEGERLDTNNYLVFRTRVIDDKVRVLYVEHPPRYEYRFLKNALIRDPKVLVHCLLTSADEGFPQEHSLEATDVKFKTPIKEFPKDLKDLLEYDVIVLGDVDPDRLGGRDTIENIRRFVVDFGGGLVFLSGVMYNPRTFRGTPLEEALPVIPEDTRESEAVAMQSYAYALTEYAKAEGGHPIIRFPEIGSEWPRLVEQWEDRDGRGDGLAGVRWFIRARAKPHAHALVEVVGVPGMDVPGKRPPLFVAADYGRGRVFWSATDETWLWRYLVGDHPWYYPFWQQTMYWAMDRKLAGARRYQIYLRPERRYVMGEPVTINANAYNKDFQPLQDPELELNVEPPQGQRYTVKLAKDKEKDGAYEGTFQPREVGSYRIWLGEDDETTHAVEKFVVYIPNREEDEPILDVPQLKRLAVEAYPDPAQKLEEKEKNFFPITRVGELPAAVQASPQQQSEKRQDDLWDSPLIYLLFALLITTEWVLRKVFRML
ncbi:MAG: hypothetical protein HY716_16870 [Planctomycetes bacterium]|nr:hypothetical protein [Planctomycetota bacterium]